MKYHIGRVMNPTALYALNRLPGYIASIALTAGAKVVVVFLLALK